MATSGFDGQQDRLSLNGTVTTATLGVDGVWEHWLTGVALAYSEGDGSFTHAETPGGELASSLTSVHPYVAYALSDRVRLWGMVGYGSGSLQLRLAERNAMDTDLAMTMGALGMRGSLLEPSQPKGGLATGPAFRRAVAAHGQRRNHGPGGDGGGGEPPAPGAGGLAACCSG